MSNSERLVIAAKEILDSTKYSNANKKGVYYLQETFRDVISVVFDKAKIFVEIFF